MSHYPRWQRARAGLRLDDPSADDFGTAGLAAYVEERSVRLLILPSDPQADIASFDSAFWEWWLTDRPEPATGQSARWLSENAPTENAAVRYSFGRTRNDWKRYLALRRSGALEMELGRSGAYSHEGHRYFILIDTVGRVWSAFALYTEVIIRFDVTGPWEITLALCNTEGSNLSGLGTGWAEPTNGYGEDHRLREPHCLLTNELKAWPDAEGLKSLAFSFGDRMEDTWGFKLRRDFPRTDQLDKQFDHTKYRPNL